VHTREGLREAAIALQRTQRGDGWSWLEVGGGLVFQTVRQTTRRESVCECVCVVAVELCSTGHITTVQGIGNSWP
jgi:hypothetical protein